MIIAEARFFDGETAVERKVNVSLSTAALEFGGSEVQRRWWPLAGLRPVTPRAPGTPLRLSHDNEPGTRLIIADEPFLAELIARAPHAGGALNYRRVAKSATVIAIVLVTAAGLIYGALTLAPQQLAFLMPESWREHLGDEIERSFVEDARKCATSDGSAVLARLENRLKEGNPDLPPVSIAIYDLPIVNAFALPGGRIVVTRKLIEAAKAPDEVAGVLAHEMGHVANRHPEAQLIRAAGLQVLLALFTGGSGGDTLGGLAGTLTILRYSRSAEREADAYALALMTRAQIDPMGLRRFFEAMRKEEGGSPGGVFGELTGMLATHPLTDERIEAIQPLPPGVAREVLPAVDWAALKKICG